MGKNRMNGFETARKIRKELPDAFICIHSNRNGQQLHALAKNAGADRFIPKSMTKRQLLELIENISSKDSQKKVGVSKIAVIEDSNIISSTWKMLRPSSEIFMVNQR